MSAKAVKEGMQKPVTEQKGVVLAPLSSRVVKALKPVLSDGTSLNIVLLIQSSEYNTLSSPSL